MSLGKEFKNMSVEAAKERHVEAVKELVKFRVSMDPTVISDSKSPIALKKEIRALRQRIGTSQVLSEVKGA